MKIEKLVGTEEFLPLPERLGRQRRSPTAGGRLFRPRAPSINLSYRAALDHQFGREHSRLTFHTNTGFKRRRLQPYAGRQILCTSPKRFVSAEIGLKSELLDKHSAPQCGGIPLRLFEHSGGSLLPPGHGGDLQTGAAAKIYALGPGLPTMFLSPELNLGAADCRILHDRYQHPSRMRTSSFPGVAACRLPPGVPCSGNAAGKQLAYSPEPSSYKH